MLGMLADRARLLPHLVVWLQMILGRLRGGMAYINVVAAMLFAGISGTAVSDIASLGRTLIQLMTRAGYPLTYSAALTSATSIIGPIIPPSVAMIIYALAVGNVSVGAMFAGRRRSRACCSASASSSWRGARRAAASTASCSRLADRRAISSARRCACCRCSSCR